MSVGQLGRRASRGLDGFAKVVKKAMATKLGEDADEVMKVLDRHGISRTLARRAA